MINVKLNQVCKILNGFAFKSEQYQNDGIPLLRISNFDDGDVIVDGKSIYVDETFLKTKTDFIVEKGDILIALSGATTGKYGIYNYDFPSLLNQRIGLIKSSASSKMNGKYFYHFLNILKDEILRKAGGAAQPNISTKTIGELEIPLPSLAKQNEICDILDVADEIRKNDKALLIKYEDLKHSLFLDIFGDPISNPMGWDVNNLKKISSKIHSGNTPKGGSDVYVEEGITFFRSQNVWKNRLVYEDIAYIDQATHDKMKKSSLKHKDILMTKTGRINTENSSLGRAAMYLGEDDKANINGHVYFIRLKKGIINEFVLHIITTKEYRGHIRSVCVGGIDKRQLNKDHIENFPIINPPIELQNKFTKMISIIEEQKNITQKSLEKSEELFNSLLQKAFNGDL